MSELFGKPYSEVGESSKGLILRNSGQVKIQFGNTFIDLMKNGKLNVDAKFIYSTDSVGNKDGIYIIGEDDSQQVILKSGDTQIELSSVSGNTYVSFQTEQETTADQKYQALTNIGFIYNNLNDINETSLQNGVIYIESEQNLYIIKDGVTTKFTASIPNPYTQQFIISKSDNNTGALVINGTGIENSLAFNSMKLYSDNANSVISSTNPLLIMIEDQEVIQVSAEGTTFSYPIITNKIQSDSANSNYGYRLYMQSGESTLEVDNLKVRNQESNSGSIYPQYWYYNNNFITSIDVISTEYDSSTNEDTLYEQLELTLETSSSYKEGDILYIYVKTTEETADNDSDDGESVVYKLVELVVNSSDDNTIITNYPDNIEYDNLINQICFLIATDTSTIIPNTSQLGFSILETSIEDSSIKTSTTSRIGDLTDLNLKGKESESDVDITGSGIYTQNLAAQSAQYTNDYQLSEDDNSTKFASTEWVQNLIAKLKEELSS